MPATGGVVDSTIISMKPIDVLSTTKSTPTGAPTTNTNAPDEREIFNTLNDCMKDVGKFRQYIYYIGTSCDTTKLRNKIQKLKEKIHRSFSNQREILRRFAGAINPVKGETMMRRFEKCLCFILASLNYYEDLLHKFSILMVYFPLASGDRSNVVNLGFEDSTITADEVSFENYEAEENETNRYIELLNHIQTIQSIREEIEKIDSNALQTNSTSYSQEFVENMHKYTTEMAERDRERMDQDRNTFRHYIDGGSITTIGPFHQRCNRRKFFCLVTISLLVLIIVAVIVTVIITTSKTSTGQ